MEFAQPQQYKARVSERYFLTENEKFLLIKLELIVPNRINFIAGQYISIKINEVGERRSYSIASTPDVMHGVTVVAEIFPNGKGSEYLKRLKIGDQVEILAPMGRFVVKGNKTKKLFVATGSGIVPIYAMINDLLVNKSETKPIRLHWGLREESDIFWFDNFERLAEAHPNFVFDLVLSKPSDEWELCRGHIQDCLKRDFALTNSAQVGLSEWEGYVCGSQEMVEEVTEVLTELKMDEEHIYHEKFV